MTTVTEMAGEKPMKSARRLLMIAYGLLAGSPALAQPLQSGVDRLYVLECGHGPAADQGRFSPGYNDGKPLDFVYNCYLIRHGQSYLLWGTGVADKFFGVPGGLPSIGGRPNWVRTNTLAAQLAQLGLGASDIRYVGLTNSHIDHIGNLEMFPGTTILVQRAEWDFAQTHPSEDTPDGARFNATHPVAKIADIAISRPTVVTVCAAGSSESGRPISDLCSGTYVPVEEPSTASKAEGRTIKGSAIM